MGHLVKALTSEVKTTVMGVLILIECATLIYLSAFFS